MTERFAIYYAPDLRSPLWARGEAWLEAYAPFAALTASARRYGFHATLKAPMRLAAGQDRAALEVALAEFAARTAPVRIGRLALRALGRFLALVPEVQEHDLAALAQAVVETFEPFRAPLSAEDRRRRLAGGLTPRQEQNLERFGYPHVGADFRFHMTLTDRLPDEELVPMTAAAEAHFAAFVGAPLTIDRLVLFHEAAPGADFTRCGDFPLGT